MVKEKTVNSEYIYKGKILNLRKDTVEVRGNKTSTREIVEHSGAVGIVAIDKEGKIVMVKQYRKAVEETVLEIPAGKLEHKEQPYLAAIRELEEETGIKTRHLTYIGEFYLSPGFSSEKMYIYLCKNGEEGIQNLDEDEDIEIVRMDYEKVLEMIEEDEIPDAKTVLGILMAKKYI